MTQEKQILFEAEEIGRALSRMAHEIVEKTTNPAELVLIGIRSRGVHLARRLGRKIAELTQTALPLGVIDVTPYRDDREREPGLPAIGEFEIAVDVDEKIVVLIDDVIFRGRTVRAALAAVARLGQPKKILVAALVDRGARELPIRADIVGKNIDADEERRVNVMLEESDGVDRITATPWQGRRAL